MSAEFIVVVSLVIESDSKALLVRRSPSSNHAPGEWNLCRAASNPVNHPLKPRDAKHSRKRA